MDWGWWWACMINWMNAHGTCTLHICAAPTAHCTYCPTVLRLLPHYCELNWAVASFLNHGHVMPCHDVVLVVEFVSFPCIYLSAIFCKQLLSEIAGQTWLRVYRLFCNCLPPICIFIFSIFLPIYQSDKNNNNHSSNNNNNECSEHTSCEWVATPTNIYWICLLLLFGSVGSRHNFACPHAILFRMWVNAWALCHLCASWTSTFLFLA